MIAGIRDEQTATRIDGNTLRDSLIYSRCCELDTIRSTTC